MTDAARLARQGELIVFGSGALAYWLQANPLSRDLDLVCSVAEAGDVVTALMGEFSWYHDLHGAYVEVWEYSTFTAPSDWRDRAKKLTVEEAPLVTIVVPHPHDILLSKVERLEERDLHHVRLILAEFPMDPSEYDRLAERMPHATGAITDAEQLERFAAGLGRVRRLVISAAG